MASPWSMRSLESDEHNGVSAHASGREAAADHLLEPERDAPTVDVEGRHLVVEPRAVGDPPGQRLGLDAGGACEHPTDALGRPGHGEPDGPALVGAERVA